MMPAKSKLSLTNTIKKSRRWRKTSYKYGDKRNGKFTNSRKQPRKGIWSIGNKNLQEYIPNKPKLLSKLANRKKKLRNRYSNSRKNRLNLWRKSINIILKVYSLKNNTWQLWVYLLRKSLKLWLTVLEPIRMLPKYQKTQKVWP